uniref:Uncharacterized protein n=1 Tax=Arundo donax TaxID=35708 RepID=A0A0A9H3I7_ARUDO
MVLSALSLLSQVLYLRYNQIVMDDTLYTEEQQEQQVRACNMNM